MTDTKSSFLSLLESEILFIRSFLFQRISHVKKQEFNNFEKVYEAIVLQIKVIIFIERIKLKFEISLKGTKEMKEYKNGVISEAGAPSIYNQFLKTLKRFKRRQENTLKLNETDIEAFTKKYQATGQTLVPLIQEIKLNENDRMNEFDINKVLDFDFQMHIYTTKQLADIAFQMFQFTNIHSNLNIEDSLLKGLIEEISLNYNIIPYHNWTHGFQLFHMLFTSYYKSDLKNFIEPFELFIGLISALGHDMNHKGVNNLYKIKRKSESSMKYVEQGVLENMHSSILFSIISLNPSLNIFSKFKDPSQLNKFKRLVVSNIISTDMGRHGVLLDQLKQKVEATQKVKQNPPSTDNLDNYFAFKKEKEADREFLINILVHACDIGNPCYSFENSMNWGYLLSQEFQDQTLKEEAKGLGVTVFLKYTGKSNFQKGQIFFGNSFVIPLWKEIATFLPDLQTLPDQIAKNNEILARANS